MKGKVRNSLIGIAVTMALIGFVGPAWAQDKPASNMDIVKEKIRTDKKLFIAENLQLTESEASAFWPVYGAYQAELEELYARMVALIESFAQNYSAMSDDMAKKILDDYLAIEADDLKLRQSYLPKFRAVMPDKKVARYYQLENKIDAITGYALAAKIPLFK